MARCPVCSYTPVTTAAGNGMVHVDCVTCGAFDVGWAAESTLSNATTYLQGKRHLLSAAIRQLSEEGHRARVTIDTVPQFIDMVAEPASPLEAMDRILLYIHTKSQKASSYVVISTHHYPIAVCEDAEEFGYLLHQLSELDLVENPGEGKYRLSLSGWRRVLELRDHQRQSDQAFVAMSFHPDMSTVWESGIKEALKETGYRPVRVDAIQHNDKICDRIIAEIRRSGVVVADFTGHRAGVYFEAGFAMGLGIPVIWTCKDTDIDKAHFDTRQYNHIVWSDPEDLRRKLVDRIDATIPGRKRT